MNSPDALGVLPDMFSPANARVNTPITVTSVPQAEPSMNPVTVRLAMSSPEYYTASAADFPPFFDNASATSFVSNELPSRGLVSEATLVAYVVLPAFLSTVCDFSFFFGSCSALTFLTVRERAYLPSRSQVYVCRSVTLTPTVVSMDSYIVRP